MAGVLPDARRLAVIEDAFRTLPVRCLAAPEGFDASYHVRLGDVGHTWEVRWTTHAARARKRSTGLLERFFARVDALGQRRANARAA